MRISSSNFIVTIDYTFNSLYASFKMVSLLKMNYQYNVNPKQSNHNYKSKKIFVVFA